MIFEPVSENDEVVTDSRSHSFPVAVAMKYSVHMALWLGHLAYWTEQHLAYNKNIHDGLCWNYNTLEGMGALIPYMTVNQRRTVIDNSIKEGLVIKGNYNKKKFDRTAWYALTPKAYRYFAYLLNENNLKALWLSICGKTQIDLGAFTNAFGLNHEPIPITIPNTKTNNISASDESQNTGYTEFDGEEVEHAKSGYAGNQSESEKDSTQVIEPESNLTKSDYFEKQTKNNAISKLSLPQELKIVQEENIFSLPEQAILDWIANRKKKRLPITPTAWKKINKELAKCKEHGIDPIDAFETFVANGWQSFKLEWFLKDKGTSENDGKNSPQSNLKNFW